MPELSDVETERIAQQITTKLAENKQTHWVESEIHYLDHQWVKHQRENQQDVKAFRDKVIQSSLAGVFVIIIVFTLKTLWKTFITTVKTGL